MGVLRGGIDWDDSRAIIQYTQSADLEWDDQRIYLDGQDVSDQIRSQEVTDKIRYVADLPEIRELLTLQQRRIAHGRRIVTEGRDQGSEVFPDAQCKIFLTASPEERAKRRLAQLATSGQTVRLEDVLAAQNQRDLEDRMRPVGRLRAAKDAIVIQSDGLTSAEVIERILDVVRSKTLAIDTGVR
ncbi:MAG: (d)CMP kinase [Planctomycetota bacterium]